MSLSFELNLDERRADRVFVSIYLAAERPMHVDGVTIQLFDPERDAMSPRLTLPIAGRLSGPLVTQAELRSCVGLPDGCTVVGTVWWGTEQLQASCPADPGTQLEKHVRGRGIELSCGKGRPTCLTPDELDRLRSALPWLRGYRPRHKQLATTFDAQLVDEYDGICSDLGLDDDAAEWLKQLLAEDDD